MDWLRVHLYLLVGLGALFLALTLVMVGSLIISSRTPVPGLTAPQAWGGSGIVGNEISAQGPTALPAPQTLQSAPPYSYTLPTLTPAAATPISAADSSFNYDSFLSMLTQENTPAQNQSTGFNADLSAYSFIPTGLVATTSAPQRSAAQDALYRYGNAVGALVQSFELSHPSMTALLNAFIQDPTAATKSQAVQALASDYATLSAHISSLADIPPSVADLNRALAGSYATLGTKLTALSRASGSDALLKAVNSYDTSADIFVKNYVALAQTFVAYGVSFSSGDAGSVFTFTGATQ